MAGFIDTDEEYENRVNGGQPDNSDYEEAQRNNAAQPRGRWDSGSQTFIPEDPTHGKASRKWNPGGIATWSDMVAQQQDAMYGQIAADMGGVAQSADDTFAEIQREGAKRQLMANTVMGKVMSAARTMFGGQITPEIANWANSTMGWDGKTSGIIGGGLQKDGSFLVQTADGANPQFNVQAQLGMAYQSPWTSNDQDRAALMKSAQLSGINKSTIDQLTMSPFMHQQVRQYADAFRARGGYGDGSAGGRNIGSVSMSGSVARRLFGVGGDNRSRISFFGTGGAGSGYTMRDYNGHTGEDTGFVDDPIRQGRTAELAKGRWKVMSVGPSEDGKTQVRVYENEQTGERRTVRDGQGLPQNQEAVELAEATRRGKGGRTFDEEKELARIRSENRIKENESVQAGREIIENLKTERDRERQRSLYKKSLGTVKVKTPTGDRRLTPEEIASAMYGQIAADMGNNRAQMRGTGSYVGDRRIGRLQAERKYWEGQRGINPDAEKMLVDINAELAEQLELSGRGRENNGGGSSAAAPGTATAPVGANGTQTAPAQVPVSTQKNPTETKTQGSGAPTLEQLRSERERRKNLTVNGAQQSGNQNAELPIFDPNSPDPFKGPRQRIARGFAGLDAEAKKREAQKMASILDGSYRNGDITQADIDKAIAYFKSKGIDTSKMIAKK